MIKTFQDSNSRAFHQAWSPSEHEAPCGPSSQPCQREQICSSARLHIQTQDCIFLPEPYRPSPGRPGPPPEAGQSHYPQPGLPGSGAHASAARAHLLSCLSSPTSSRPEARNLPPLPCCSGSLRPWVGTSLLRGSDRGGAMGSVSSPSGGGRVRGSCPLSAPSLPCVGTF